MKGCRWLVYRLENRLKNILEYWENKKHIKGKYFFRNFGGHFKCGYGIKINSSMRKNPTSYGNDTAIIVEGGTLEIKDNVGISNSSIYCRNRITIMEDVLIGGNCKILDSDHHELNYTKRRQRGDWTGKSKPIVIGKGAFISSNCIITKGAIIGEGSVISPASVVGNITIPNYEIWGGNPIRKIKDVILD